MKLIEAVTRANGAVPDGAKDVAIFLACGFEPLHLKTFLTAYERMRCPDARVVVETGLFGDLAGNLGRAAKSGAGGCAVVMEWGDLDSRLGLREGAVWQYSMLDDTVVTVSAALDRVATGLAALSERMPVVLGLPGLPLPPLSPTTPGAVSGWELELRSLVAMFASRVARSGRIRVVGQQLDVASPLALRYDIRADFLNGFPYSSTHADALASAISRLLHPAEPKKGIITDLDDTLWKGIVGDAGPNGVAWDLAGKSRVHGLYQQVLRNLSSRGVLVGVASKNDPAVVKQTFARTDMLLPEELVYPLSVHWRPKSESVADILKAWNVGPDSVIFIDDNPMELAEVKAAHPAVETVQFPKDPGKFPELLDELNRWYGKESVGKEDLLRADSIRAGAVWREAGTGSNDGFDQFLAQAEATVTITLTRPGPTEAARPGRPFELVNKTNQFNLNGRRISEPEWARFFETEGSFLATVGYQDKFGALGIVSVVLGRDLGEKLVIDQWVMSCRAFSRRIEHQFLKTLLAQYPAASEVEFDYVPTERNGPAREFLETMGSPESPFVVTRERFGAVCPGLCHAVEISCFESKEQGGAK